MIALRYSAAANRARGAEPGNGLAGFGVRAGERFGRICPLGAAGDRAYSTRRSRVRAGERFGRICPARRVVATHRFAANPGLRFDAAVAPAELEQGENLRFLRHLQVVGPSTSSRD